MAQDRELTPTGTAHILLSPLDADTPLWRVVPMKPVPPGFAAIVPVFLAAVLLAVVAVYAGEGFDNCAASFHGDDVQRAPKRTNPTAASQADSVPLCYHQGGTTFFAVDYSPKRLNDH
jgi:hypothetical protein